MTPPPKWGGYEGKPGEMAERQRLAKSYPKWGVTDKPPRWAPPKDPKKEPSKTPNNLESANAFFESKRYKPSYYSFSF